MLRFDGSVRLVEIALITDKWSKKLARLRLTIFTLLTAFLFLAAKFGLCGPIGKISYFTSWDDAYFYIGVRVQNPDVIGLEKTPNSNPWNDDSVEIFIERDNKKATTMTPNSFQLAVSPAGGTAFLVGDGVKAQKKPVFNYKYAYKVIGTLNRSDDVDIGFDAEMAIPWSEMGGPPLPGTPMGFNIIARSHSGGFVSLSPEVKTEEDIFNPSKWVEIKFIGPAAFAMTTGVHRTISTKAAGRPPFIDGNFRQYEWNKNTSFAFGTELKITPPSLSAPPNLTQRLVLTHYYYWYQGDSRKTASAVNVRSADGKLLLTDHPIRGIGPWVSYDRVSWHESELTDIRRAGIDVILPVYNGDAKSRALYAAKGLDVLVQALYNLKNDGKEYPLVGMCFDTTAMQAAFGGSVDLRNEDAKRAFYGMLRDFFLSIPEEFRAVAPLDPDKKKTPSYIVRLTSANAFSDIDAELKTYCESRFAEDFKGAGITWIASSDFKEKVPDFDAFCTIPNASGVFSDPDGWLRMAGIGAGFDNSAIAIGTPVIVSRKGALSYKNDWMALLNKKLDWVLVDRWNDYASGAEISASRQYGYTYVDQTAIHTLKFRAFRDYLPAFVRHNTPSQMLPGALYQIDMEVRNAGSKPWKKLDAFALAYRWFKDGQLVSNGATRLPLQHNLPPGETLRVTIGLITMDDKNQPLPEGDYELRWDILQKDDVWLTSAAGVKYGVSVKIGKREGLHYRILSADGPALVKTGSTYNYKLRIRNESAETWTPASSLSIGCRMFRTASFINSGAGDEMSEVQLKSFESAINSNVPPGNVIVVNVPVTFTDNASLPIPIAEASSNHYYLLTWSLRQNGKWLDSNPLEGYTRTVQILDSDYGVDFEISNSPTSMEAGKEYEIKVFVSNLSPEAWTKGRFALGYHWFHLDGSEYLWEGKRVPLRETIKPGDKGIASVKVIAPSYDGQYLLALDLCDGEKWISTSSNSKGTDLLVVPVIVSKGKLAFADLSKYFDNVAASFDTAYGAGNFDGRGNSIPAEFLPPEASVGVADASLMPSNYLGNIKYGKDHVRIFFKMPPKTENQPNAVSCKGQTITLPPGKYSTLHILASAAEDLTGEFSAVYGTETAPIKIAITSWDKEAEKPGFAVLHRHSAKGDIPGVSCHLGHYSIELDPAKTLTGLKVPDLSAIKLFAITLERP